MKRFIFLLLFPLVIFAGDGHKKSMFPIRTVTDTLNKSTNWIRYYDGKHFVSNGTYLIQIDNHVLDPADSTAHEPDNYMSFSAGEDSLAAIRTSLGLKAPLTAPDFTGPVDINTSGSSFGLKIDGNKTTGDIAQFINDADGAVGDSSAYINKLGILYSAGSYPVTSNVGILGTIDNVWNTGTSGTWTLGDDSDNIDGQLNFVASDNDQGSIYINTTDQCQFSGFGGGVEFNTSIKSSALYLTSPGTIQCTGQTTEITISSFDGHGNINIDIFADPNDPDGEIRLGDTGTAGEYTTIDSLGSLSSPEIKVKANQRILLPASGTLTDGQFAATKAVSLTAGYGTTAIGDLVYLNNDDSKFEKTDGNAAATAADVLVGVVLEAVAEDASCLIMLEGTITVDAWNWTTVGASVWISGTAGEFTQTRLAVTNDIVRIMGYALDDDTILFDPDDAYSTVE